MFDYNADANDNASLNVSSNFTDVGTGSQPINGHEPSIHFGYSRSREVSPDTYSKNRTTQHQADSFEALRDAVLADTASDRGKQYICAPMTYGPHNKPHDYPQDDYYRLASHVQARGWLPLDIDGMTGRAAMDELLRVLENYSCFAYTTSSHTEGSPRLRVVMELDRLVGRDESIALGGAVEDMLMADLSDTGYTLGDFGFDRSVYYTEQQLYMPLADSQTFTYEGDVIGVDDTLRGYERVGSGENGCASIEMPTGYDPSQAVDQINAGESIHEHIRSLTGHYAAKGHGRDSIRGHAMNAIYQADRPGERISDLLDGELDRMIDGALHKYAPEQVADSDADQSDSGPCRDALRIKASIDNQISEAVDGMEMPKADADVIDQMINGAFWSGSSSKLFILAPDESVNQFTSQDAYKFLARTFGKVVDDKQIEALLNDTDRMEDGEADKAIKECKRIYATEVLDYLKYNNQRDEIEWRVDMFANRARMEMREDKVRIVLTHRPFVSKDRVDNKVIDDFQQHFPRLDQFIDFLVASRFVADRKKSYLWILADSDWGKGFLMSALGNLGAVVSTSVNEVESMLEGKPVGRSIKDFKRPIVMHIDEFKTVKSELKQLQSEIELSPKHQLTSSVEIFAKVFTSAEQVSSLVTENGVEDQFANRMNIFQESGDLTAREVFQSVGQDAYMRSVTAYLAQELNRRIADMQALGRKESALQAEQSIEAFNKQYALDTIFPRMSDQIPNLAEDIIEWLRVRDGWDNGDRNFLYQDGHCYLKSAPKYIADYLAATCEKSQQTSLGRKKPEIMAAMSADGKGYENHRVHGVQRKTVKISL